MKTYEFSLILKADQLTDEQCELIYESGCSDGTIVTRDGVSMVLFDREADSLEAAIRSATDDVSKAGLTVARIEMDVLV